MVTVIAGEAILAEGVDAPSLEKLMKQDRAAIIDNLEPGSAEARANRSDPAGNA